MLRLFVALPLPESVCDRLTDLTGGIPGANWTPPDNFHLTLRFIGEVDEGVAEDIDEALDLVVAPTFSLTLEGLGRFGSGDRSRLLWAGVERNQALEHLRQKIESAVVRAGLPPEERRFTPHVTLARLDSGAHPGKVIRFLEERGLFREGPILMDRFVLYESVLGKGHAVYHELQSYPLGGWRPSKD